MTAPALNQPPNTTAAPPASSAARARLRPDRSAPPYSTAQVAAGTAITPVRVIAHRYPGGSYMTAPFFGFFEFDISKIVGWRKYLSNSIIGCVTRNVRTYDHFCLVARALEQVGDRWSLLV